MVFLADTQATDQAIYIVSLFPGMCVGTQVSSALFTLFPIVSRCFAVPRAGDLPGAIAQPIAGLATRGLARIAIYDRSLNTRDAQNTGLLRNDDVHC